MNKIRKIGIIMVLFIIVVMMQNKTYAALQANKGGTSLKSRTTADEFFKGIRAMEASGGTLGKNANYNAEGRTDYIDTSENGLDCHMAKNTEWGTAAMLSASAYGSAPRGTSSASTTGNESGVYQMADAIWEFVATSYENTSNTYNKVIKNADGRYFNLYKSQTSIPGDATTETAGWLGATNSNFVNASYPVFLRGYNNYVRIGYLFGYGNSVGNFYSDNDILSARAVVVCAPRTLKYSK